MPTHLSILGGSMRGLSTIAARASTARPAACLPLTKIVATIGPASEEAEPLARCVSAGFHVMRINFSHATREEFHLRQRNLRNAVGGERVAIMLDTKGPEIRMGGLAVCKETGNRKAKVLMEAGAEITLTTDPTFDGASDASKLYIGYPALASKLVPGQRVLLDDGLISLEVKAMDLAGGDVLCAVVNTAEIGERKGVNLPGIVTGLPPLSDKDREDIRFGVEHDIDMVAASFVRSAEGVRQIRDYVSECHARYSPQPDVTPLPLIISKIESTEALDNLEEIVAVSDGIMVARGDLGVEVPVEQVVIWQKEMVALCEAAGKPVIVATQMLESMQNNPRPTRAEVADITNAVLERADAVMLSGESANGKYPDTSVAMQASIASSAENWATEKLSTGFASPLPPPPPPATTLQACAAAAAQLAHSIGASGIVVAETGVGEMTRAVSACKPGVPIVAVCSSLKVCRQLILNRGVHPICENEVAATVDSFGNGLAQGGAILESLHIDRPASVVVVLTAGGSIQAVPIVQ